MRKLSCRIISLILVLISIITMLPIVSYADDSISGDGTGAGEGGGGAAGTFSSEQFGYRIYMVNPSGEVVSNVVDFVYKDPTAQVKNGYYLVGTKFNSGIDLLAVTPVAEQPVGNYTMILMQDLTVSTIQKGQWPKPIIGGNPYLGNGDAFREWFMKGVIDEGSRGGGGSSGSYKPIVTKPSSGGSNSNKNQSTTKPDTSKQTITNFDIYKEVSHAMYVELKSRKDLGYSKSESVAYAVSAGKQMVAKIKKNHVLDQTGLNILAQTLAETVDEMDRLLDWPNTRNMSSIDKGSSSGDKIENPHTDKKPDKGNIRDKDFVPNTKLGSTTNSLYDSYTVDKEDSFITISYADNSAEGGTDAPSADPSKGQLFQVMNYEYQSGELLFKFLPSSGITTQTSAVTNKPSITTTVCSYDLKIIVEPIFWFRPAQSKWNGTYNSRGNKVYVAYNACARWFYGTPTDYGKFIKSGVYNDGGKGGHYTNTINKVGSHSLLFENDLVLGSKTVKAITKAPFAVPSTQLADCSMGYAMQYYYGKASSGLPQIPTYDTPKGETPHPAPDPNPNIPAEQGGIPLAKGEPTVPGDPDLLAETEDDKYRGYLTETRTVTIVKVYEKEDASGIREHVKTTIRENCPGTILIQHEPQYKVIEYFSSPFILGEEVDEVLTDPVTEQTSWEFIDMQLTNISRMNARKNETKFEWAEVSKAQAGATQGTVRLGIAADDPSDIGKDDPMSSYNDKVLYVRLLIKEGNETHTYDPNVPGEGPAPDPTTDPNYPPVSPDNIYLRHRIVKTYESLNTVTGDITHITTTERYPTVPNILIEDEPQYKVIEWKYGSPYTQVSGSTKWTDPEIQGVQPDDSGTTSGDRVNIIDKNDPNKEVTLYVRLQKKYTPPAPVAALNDDLTESQLTKLSQTNNAVQGWDGYEFNASIAAVDISHSYIVHHGGCGDEDCGDPCCQDAPGTCSHISRARSDQSIHVVYGIKSKDSKETTVSKPSAHADFAGKMYGKGGTLADTITWREDSMHDGADSWTWVSDGTITNGIEYVTTLSRESIGDNLNIAQYKKSAMDATSYTRVKTVYPEANKPTKNRLANGVLNKSLGYTFGFVSWDNHTVASCSGCGCPSHHSVVSRNYDVSSTSTTQNLSGAFQVHIYGGLQAKNATSAPTNIKNFYVQYAGGTSSNSALYVKQQSATIKFYPYVKMSYLVTSDIANIANIHDMYKTSPATNNSRTVYMLSDKLSTILPTNSVEASWYNKTQADDGYGLQMASQQWSVHNKATQGTDGWQGTNQVLPGGALYSLATTGTETYVKLITYNTLVENDSRTWITVSDQSKYTTQSIVNSTQDFLKEAKKVLENFRIVEWVNTNITLENAWKNPTTAVKIAGGGESLANLNLRTKASTDAKYVLVNGTDGSVKGASEADIDIMTENYQTTVYKGFTDVDGNVYIASIAVNTDIKMLDQSTLDSIAGYFKLMVATTPDKSTIPGLPSNMTYSCVKIGNKSQNATTIINNLMNNSTYNYLYQLDLKTKFITNVINSVERNTGNDTLNASWTTDGKWYNEAFDGIYVVQQTATYKMGLGAPSKRVSVLDPNLCPAKTSTGNIYTTAHLSQFCLDPKSTEAPNEDDGYIATFEGTKVYMPASDTMFYSRPFFIPNANVQDLT